MLLALIQLLAIDSPFTPRSIDLGPIDPVAREVWRNALPLWPFVTTVVLLIAILAVLVLILREMRRGRAATPPRGAMPVVPIESGRP